MSPHRLALALGRICTASPQESVSAVDGAVHNVDTPLLIARDPKPNQPLALARVATQRAKCPVCRSRLGVSFRRRAHAVGTPAAA
jgi:hypothetical protein